MIKKLRIIVGVLIFAVWVLFLIKAIIAVDTDFGWHIKTGEVILSQGIPHLDPFSYSMSSYKFVDHEWLTDVGMAKLFLIVGFWGLGIIFTIMAIASVFLVVDFLSIKALELPVLISSLMLLFFGGSRPQVISWFFISLLFWIIFRSQKWVKLKYWLPILFLMWSNLHGGFVAGLVVLSVVVVCQMIEKKAVRISDLAVLFSSILATFVNPYGIALWKEIFVSINDKYLRIVINEWTTPFLSLDLAFITLLAFSGFLVFIFRKKLTLAEIILYLFFTLSALSSNRNIPLWIFFALLLLPKLMIFVLDVIHHDHNKAKLLQNLYVGGAIFTLVITALSLFISVPEIIKFRLSKYYPVAAVEYIKKQQPSRQIIAPYTWGGYLIWQLPDYKVFIDGRMPSWKNDNPPANESGWVLKEYQDLLSGKISAEQLTDKYQINTVFWPVGGSKEFFPSTLNTAIWKEIYRDQTSIIYSKK